MKRPLHIFAGMVRSMLFIFVISLVVPFGLRSQTINLSDSLSQILRHKPSPTVRFDTRNSFITGNSVRVYGIKAGLSFRQSLAFGFGYNWISKGVRAKPTNDQMLHDAELRMRYVSLFADYIFYKKGSWEATVPVQVGYGISYWKKPDGQKLNSGGIALYEPMMTVEYKVLHVLAVGGGLGYRIMLHNNREIDQQFTSPVYVLRVRILFEELWRRVQPEVE
ncbi:MAG: hypothetical protein ACKVOR_00985 [Flavobacteriales bacterium]